MGKDVPVETDGVAKAGSTRSAKESTGVSVVDVLRILGGLFLLNCLLSYFITNDSLLWGYRPWYVRPNEIMRYIVRLLLHLTLAHNPPLTHSLPARPRLPNRPRTQILRRHRPKETHLPRPKRHNLRRHRRSPPVWSGWWLPCLCRCRRSPRLHHWLFRRGLHARFARRRVDVRSHGRGTV